MRDTPRPAASTKNKTSIAEAELQLAAALRDGVCTDPFGQLGPHAGGGDGHFRLRAYLPGSAAVTVLARETREPLARLEAVDDSGLFAGDMVLNHRAAFMPMSLNLTLPPLAVLWFEPETAA